MSRRITASPAANAVPWRMPAGNRTWSEMTVHSRRSFDRMESDRVNLQTAVDADKKLVSIKLLAR